MSTNTLSERELDVLIHHHAATMRCNYQAGAHAQARYHAYRMGALIASRSPSHVRRIEDELGLHQHGVEADAERRVP